MASNASTVVVFGPTGNVGSIAATTAAKHGAKVILAMRDTNKTIPGLSKDDEASDGYERVQADLTKPESIASAINGASAKPKAAFIYLAIGSQDHMKATVQALKDAGIEFVVFLSSYTILDRAIQDVPADDLIPFFHAQVELNLESIFGSANYVALRPGGFATNVMHWKKGITEGHVQLFCPQVKFDYITPDDMGRVSGTILAKGQQEEGDRNVCLFGREITSQADAVKIISKVAGRDIKSTEIDQQTFVEAYTANGIPAPIATYLGHRMAEADKESVDVKHPEMYKQGVENVEKYTGQQAMSFKEWAEQNKQLFSA